MAGDSIGCAARKKSKNKNSSEYSLSENEENSKNKPPPVRTTRGGLRVYKIVILGDGGVGKSGSYAHTYSAHMKRRKFNKTFAWKNVNKKKMKIGLRITLAQMFAFILFQ